MRNHQRLGKVDPIVNNPVRIAFIITELEVGGAERCLVNLATGLDRSRYTPIVCSLGGRPPAERNALVDQLEADSIPTHFLNAQSAWSFPRVKGHLAKVLRSHNAQLIQTFLFHGNVLGTLAARAAKVPHIVTGIRVADPPRLRLAIERFTSRHVDRIVCVSDSVAEFVQTKGGFSDSKLRVIPNGIDLSQYPAVTATDLTQFGISEGRRVLVCIGRLHHQKGIDWLLQAAADLLSRLPDHDLLIVGDGPDRTALTRLAESPAESNRIHLVGWQPNVCGILAACDALLLPSRWEGMPNVLIEAMASGLPVVATKVEGVQQVLGPLFEEQVVAFGDTVGLVKAVTGVADSPGQAVRLGALNRERIAEEFSLQAMISRYEAIYTSLVGSTG